MRYSIASRLLHDTAKTTEEKRRQRHRGETATEERQRQRREEGDTTTCEGLDPAIGKKLPLGSRIYRATIEKMTKDRHD